MATGASGHPGEAVTSRVETVTKKGRGSVTILPRGMGVWNVRDLEGK